MKFTRTTVYAHIVATPSQNEHRLKLPGYKFVLPDTNLVLVVHRTINRTLYHERFYTTHNTHKLSKRWVVTEPTTGKRLMDPLERESKTREAAVVSAGKAMKKNGMKALSLAIMKCLPDIIGLEVRCLHGGILTPERKGGAQ